MNRVMKLPLLLCAVASTALLSGCVATSNELVGLRDDIYQLQLRLGEMQRNQADISAKMDTLDRSMKSLNATLDDTQTRLSLSSQRLDDVDANLSQRMNKLSEQLSGQAMQVSPPPSEIYRLAYSDFSRGKYDLAVVGFRTYLERYPQGEIAGHAQYYLGESFYAKSDWEKALGEFELVEKDYAHSKLVPAARFKRALCLEQLGKPEIGRELLTSLINDFPESPEAFTAQEKLGVTPQ